MDAYTLVQKMLKQVLGQYSVNGKELDINHVYSKFRRTLLRYYKQERNVLVRLRELKLAKYCLEYRKKNNHITRITPLRFINCLH